MKNLVTDGCVANIELDATVESGELVIIGDLVGVAVTGGVSGDTIAVNLKGVYTLPKNTLVTLAKGDAVYYDETNKEVSSSMLATVTHIGTAWEDADNGDETAQVLLLRVTAPTTEITPQPAIDLTVADATGNTTGDINGVKDAIMGKVDEIHSALITAGILITP